MTSGIGRKPTDADYGLGEHSFDADRLGLMDENELTERLVRTFSEPGYSPPRLPAVATEMLALTQQRDVEFSAIESLLEKDAVLAGEVICLARSAHYSRVRPVTTLREALVRVGLRQLQDVVMQAAMNMRVFRSKAYAKCMERLRNHSNCTAHLCRIVSRYTPMGDEQAFLCGLLHDVGIAGILLSLGDVKRGQSVPDLGSLWPAIDRAHTRAGAKMVELWNLPSEISGVVGIHHDASLNGVDHPMAAIVCLAESLTSELNMGLAPESESQLKDFGLHVHARVDYSGENSIARACHVLGLDESKLDLVRSDAQKWAAAETGGP